MKLRKAKEEDIQKILDIHNDLFDYQYSYDNYANELAYDISKFMVLVNEDTIIGYFIVHLTFEIMDLVIIAIRKEYQQQGYGQFLLDYILYIALDNQISKIILEVAEDNESAIKFYRKYRFEEIAVRKKYYGSKDAIIMERGV